MGWLFPSSSERAEKRKLKQEIKLAKIDAKTDRVKIRQEEKSDRAEDKYKSFEVAYTNKIDPNEQKYKAISSVADSTGKTLGSIFGNSGKSLNLDDKLSDLSDNLNLDNITPKKEKNLKIIGVIIGVISVLLTIYKLTFKK